jgi:hypothetical protein
MIGVLPPCRLSQIHLDIRAVKKKKGTLSSIITSYHCHNYHLMRFIYVRNTLHTVSIHLTPQYIGHCESMPGINERRKHDLQTLENGITYLFIYFFTSINSMDP